MLKLIILFIVLYILLKDNNESFAVTNAKVLVPAPKNRYGTQQFIEDHSISYDEAVLYYQKKLNIHDACGRWVNTFGGDRQHSKYSECLVKTKDRRNPKIEYCTKFRCGFNKKI